MKRRNFFKAAAAMAIAPWTSLVKWMSPAPTLFNPKDYVGEVTWVSPPTCLFCGEPVSEDSWTFTGPNEVTLNLGVVRWVNGVQQYAHSQCCSHCFLVDDE